jgi:soluble lytic murein transglycosylase
MKFRIILAVLILTVLSTSSLGITLEAQDAFKKGYDLFEKGDYRNSINYFKTATHDTSFTLIDYVYYYAAKAYQKCGYFKEAAQVYDIVLKYFKDSILAPKALFEIAKMRSESEDYSSAINALREFISLYPGHELVPRARYLLGLNLEKTGKHVDAARVYRNLDLIHPDSDFAENALERLDWLAKKSPLAGYEAPAATIYNLGIKYFKQSNYTKSKEYFSRLTRFYKKSSFYDEAVLMLGRIYLRKEKLKEAVSYFKKAINLGKDSKPEAMFYLALTYGYLDSPRAAIRSLEKLVAMYPNSHPADDGLYYIGRYHRELNDSKSALQAYEKLVSLYPNSELYPEAIWLTGNMYYKQGNYAAAYASLGQALKLPPEKTTDKLIFWAAKCADKIGKHEAAVAAYKMTINRFDHSYYGYRAREELRKYGIHIKANTVPDVSEIIEVINGESIETASHEQKYRELLALGLGDEAAEEASFLVEKVPLSKKDKALIAKYHAYVMKGKFSKPIWFADRKINEAVLSGTLSQVDPRLWRFSYPRGYWKYVQKYSKEYGLDPYLVYAVIREESRFKSRALSRSWAHGLMQIIPSTGRSLSRLLGMSYSRWKLYNPRVNIQMGTYYLANLIKRFDGSVELALAGYNGGPVRVKKWLKKYKKIDIDEFVEDIPFRETRNYVKKVIKSYYGYKRTYSGG